MGRRILTMSDIFVFFLFCLFVFSLGRKKKLFLNLEYIIDIQSRPRNYI